MTVTLERGRIDRQGRDLTITIPSPAPLFQLAFMTAWCGFFVYGYAFLSGAKQRASASADPNVALMMAVMLGAFLFVGALLWLWMAFGREVVSIKDGRMSVTRQIFFIPLHWRNYDVAKLRELRVDWKPIPSFNDASRDPEVVGRFWGYSGGSVAFEHGGDVQRLAINASEADARAIVEHISSCTETPLETAADRTQPEYLESRVIERNRGILIEVPPPKLKAVTGYTMFAMVIASFIFWVFAGIPAPPAFTIVFVLVGAGITAAFLFQFAWNLWRRETIAVDNDVIVIDRQLFGWHRRERLRIVPEAKLYYERSRRLTTTRHVGTDRGRGAALMTGINFGPIVYRAGKLQRRFGEGLSESEALYLLERIHAKSPSLID